MARLLIDKVVKVYGEGEQEVTALAGVSLTVDAGEFVAIVGPSGSGKTTLLAVAGGLLQPTSGNVAIDGHSLAGERAARMARLRLEKIGFVLQSSNLVPFLRARDQLLYVGKIAGVGDREARTRSDALLGELGIANRAHHYPEALSGGERQRVAIARALMNDPAVLLCDEPTASLDSHRGRQVVEMLAHEIRQRGKAGVMVTHDERMLDLVDRVYRIADGVMHEEPVGALRP